MPIDHVRNHHDTKGNGIILSSSDCLHVWGGGKYEKHQNWWGVASIYHKVSVQAEN